MLRISVIIPVFNSQKYLDKCLESIRCQSFKNLEVIIINDGSTDNSVFYIKQFAETFSNTIVIDRPNRGVMYSRFEGIRVATGDYICFVDSDDYLDAKHFELISQKLELYKPDILSFKKYTVVENKEIAEGRLSKKEALRFLLTFKYPTSMWANAYSSQLAKQVAFDENISFLEDLLFNYICITKSNAIFVCDLETYFYNNVPTGLSKMKISKKRMTCLNVADYINEKNNELISDLKNEICFFNAHILVSLISALVFPKKEVKPYIKEISYRCRLFLKEIYLRKSISKKYILAIWITAFFPNVACFFAAIRRKIR